MQTTNPSIASDLRLYTTDELAVEQERLFQQLPFLSRLLSDFELATGWEAAFRIMPRKGLSTLAIGNGPTSNTIFGKFEICDLSCQLAPRESARSRRKCDQLAAAINQLIDVIQDDRMTLESAGTRLQPVQWSPFDWWTIRGNVGFRRGLVCHWSVSGREHLRLVAANLKSDCAVTQTIAAGQLYAAAQTLAHGKASLFECIEAINNIQSNGAVGFSALGIMDIDPISGDYQLVGERPNHTISIIDVDSRTAARLAESDVHGTIYPGQLLVICGDFTVDVERELRRLPIEEATIDQIRQKLESIFSGLPLMMLHRK
jgi:hypothetical protein